MKYNTISTSSLVSAAKKSTLTIYADMDISQDKLMYTEAQMASIRGELEIVQKALKLQTRRCRQLVTEYTRKLQEKEQQFHSEKALRDDQLAKVLRALLIFEARLRQEQKFITHQLNEKDFVIKKQNSEIKKLSTMNQYCKNCNQYYASSPVQESLNSSYEYVVTDYHDYQSSNFESLDSSSETYGTQSEKSSAKTESLYSYVGDDNSKSEIESNKNIYLKNRNKDSFGRRSRKIKHRKSIGTYFEVLKLRNDNASPCSNEDNTSNDYDNLDSLPPESITDKISLVSENIEEIFKKSEEERKLHDGDTSSQNITVSEFNETVIPNEENFGETPESPNSVAEAKNLVIINESKVKISDSIPVFEGDGETNDKWYASASDQEDEEQRDIYRNNPVLECMNQILLQNINDPLNSPPKTPNIERKSNQKNNKRVKFSDEDDTQPEKQATLTKENVGESNNIHDYYETPIQKTPNFYETPQSIYSNDYEQILSKCSETFSSSSSQEKPEKQFRKLSNDSTPTNHYYIDMDTKTDSEESIDNNNKNVIVRKSKILRTPPALPPKPANLVSRYKIQNESNKTIKESSLIPVEFEPDYCSISELNLPQTKNASFKKINVVAEINSPTSNDVKNKLEKAASFNKKKPEVIAISDYDPVAVTENVPNLVVKKCVEKINIQIAKQTTIKSELSPKKSDQDIPKLPQVSEIIIPDESEDEKQKEERITQDNYVKNNSTIFKLKSSSDSTARRPIVIGSSVSSLISGFNNQLLSEIKKKPERGKADNKHMFASFENLQNLDKHHSKTTNNQNEKPLTTSLSNFDLSQNFEEFKLDECEIEEYNVDSLSESDKGDNGEPLKTSTPQNVVQNSTRVDIIRATTNNFSGPTLNKNSIDKLKKQLELQKSQSEHGVKENYNRTNGNEPTYEHFLECTGLSSKSILTPSRMLSNHKSMLKPKDVKLRSKVKANNLIDRHSTSSMKYWSEPYI